jgi:predicted nucleotidyltransferase
MNNEDILEALNVLIHKVGKSIPLRCVILFGSRARKDYTLHSDIDIIFVGDFLEKFINRSLIVLENFDIHLGLGIDAFCYTPDEFEKMFYEGVVSILDAIDHGKCLYGLVFFKKYEKKLEYLKSKGLRREPPVWILPAEMSLD